MATLIPRRALAFLWLPFLSLVSCYAETKDDTFVVVTYNVENLFDVDGVAMFSDYQQVDGDSMAYTRAKFLTKLQSIVEVLQTINDGRGPEVVLFQELEADFTPESGVDDYDAFIDAHRDQSVADMLGENWSDEYAGIPSEAWLLKALSDSGMRGYNVVAVPSKGMDSGIAHANAIFSKFPIHSVALHPLLEARDILEAKLDVDGHDLHVYVNHWKSGASNPEREPIRVQNAQVLRELLDHRLAENPAADILVAGDLNSHYNHSILYPDIETGINDVLGSAGDEAFGETDLYNLWYELIPEARYSEVWRGRRGTLMHMLVTQGLYDAEGISYVDGSYDKLMLPGLNVDAIGRPLAWSSWGKTGGGASDHLPVLARFRVGEFEPTAELSDGSDALDFEMPLGVDASNLDYDWAEGGFLSELPESELGPYMGRVYTIGAVITQKRPFRLQVNDKEWRVYVPDRDLRSEVYAFPLGEELDLVVTLGEYRGNVQFVIEALR